MTTITSKVYVVTDLGPGDGGKGGVVHKICEMMQPSRGSRVHTVLKRGGAQGSHGVCTSKGQRFAFSQWGCGTLMGIPTHCTEQMIISPIGLLNEASHLQDEHGIFVPEAFRMLTIDERSLCATPFHGIASRLYELSRGVNPRGTIGTGVGEAYRNYQKNQALSIFARDLTRPGMRDRLAAIREAVQAELIDVIEGDFLPDDQAQAKEEVLLLFDDAYLDFVVERFAEVSKLVNVVGPEFLGDNILRKEGSAVVETSHGVLTDRCMGFYPHTSAIRTLPRFTHGLLREAGFEGQVVNLGITRAYAIRHGAGPLPTNDYKMAERLLDGSAKLENRYQGKVRVGPLDTVLLRYAIEACGGPGSFDGLAVTWFDQVLTDGVWEVCHNYNGADDPTFFTPQGAIQVDFDATLQHQQALGQKLLECSPEIIRTSVDSDADAEVVYDQCAETMEAATGIPVRMVSVGPTELDKLLR